MAWYDPSWLYRQKITVEHTLVAEHLTDFPLLITDAVVQANLFAHARSDGADIVVTAGDETTRLNRELITYDAMAGELELYVKIPSLSSVTDTEIYVYYGNAGASETSDADTWNADYGVVYHLKEDPAGTAPHAKDSTANAVHGTYDVAGATVEDNTLWGGQCILFDSGPRLRIEDDPAIENADRITIEAWVNTLSWPGRAVVCRKEGSYILYNFSGGFSWYLFGPDNRLQYDIAGTLGNGSWGYIVGTYDKDAGANNQRLYLNGARVAQMSDTLPIDLNSAALGIGRHVSGVADPFNGHIDEFRIAHVQRSDGWIATTWNNMSNPGAFAAAGAEEQQGGEPPPLAGTGGRLHDGVRASVRCRPGLDWQFCGSHALDEAYVLSVGAFGAAWDDGMVARWSANPLGMLWPEMDAALATSGGENGGPAGRGAAVGRSAGPGPFKRFHIEGFAGRRDFLIEASGGSSISPTAVGPNRNCSMGRGVPKSTA